MADPPAEFQRLYEAEVAYLVRTLRRLGVAAADVEDAAQEVFLVAYRQRDARDQARPVRPWLFGISYRIVGNYRQKAHRRREVATDDVAAVETRLSPADAVEQGELRQMLLRALDELDLEHRAVAVLYEIEEMSAAEIAETLTIPINTVYSRARTARQKLIDIVRAMRGGK